MKSHDPGAEPVAQSARAAAKPQNRSKMSGDSGEGVPWPRLLASCWPVFVVALLIRCIYLWESAGSPVFLAPIADANYYDEVANLLVQSGDMHRKLFFQSFFYPVFLAVIYALTHSSLIAVKVVQACIGAATCTLVCATGRELFDKRAGMIAGFAAAVYGPLIFFDGELLTANLEAFWTALLLFLLIRAPRWTTLFPFALLGGLLAIVAITRATFLPFLAVATLWLAAAPRLRAGENAQALKRFAALCIGWAVVLLPVTCVYWSQTGVATFLPASGGINLFIGNNPNYQQTITTRPGIHYDRMINQAFQERLQLDNDFERSRFFMGKVVAYVVEQPISFLAGLGRKGLELVSSRELPNITSIYLFHEWSALLRVLVWKIGPFGFPFGLVIPLALVGVAGAWRKIPAGFWQFLGLFSLSIILAHVNDRYRLPLVIPLLVLAAQGALDLGRSFLAKDFGNLGRQAAMVAAVLLVVTIPGPFIQETLGSRSEIYAYGAEYHAMRKEEATAIALLERAVAIDPANAQAHTNLADLQMKNGDNQQAYQHLRQAIEHDPREFCAMNNLGKLLVQSGLTAEGIEWYQQALALAPDRDRRVEVLGNLGLAHASQGDFAKAEQLFEDALRLDRQNARIHNMHGVAHTREGRRQEAIADYREALRLDPGFTQARINLGAVLSDVGRPAEAIPELQQAVREQPASAMARYNLGVAQEQLGYVGQALDSYEKTLQLAPDYAKAQLRLQGLLQRTGT